MMTAGFCVSVSSGALGKRSAVKPPPITSTFSLTMSSWISRFPVSPDEASSLLPLLVRELGLRHETPYDLADELDVNEANFDGLQVALILVGLTLPVIADEAPLDTPASTLVADSDGILTANQWALLPREPLLAGGKYTILLRGTLDGQAFEKHWSFTAAS